jgi:hypothetical protein
MPLFPLFECLSPENIMALFALVLTERQLIFVSSQYSLLTSCAEAITSLIYPLSWTHAYIPILPRQLLGKLLCSLVMPFGWVYMFYVGHRQDYETLFHVVFLSKHHHYHQVYWALHFPSS